jgi:enolase|tara:strand:- start:53 stop:1930 length:1878 start_codon:yes stop_codon:yes gene_type:complete
MVLVVLRHGQSEWNKSNRFTGWHDVSLSEEGIEQAKKCGEILQDYKFDYIFTSELIRTKETSSYIQSYRDLDSYKLVSNEALNERDYGSLTGKNKDELKKEYGDDQVYKWRRGYTDRPPEGESLQDVHNRVQPYYDNVISSLLKEDKNVLIVSHGNTLRALFVHLGIKTINDVEQFEISTGIPLFVDLVGKTYKTENSYEFHGYQILDSRGHPTLEVKCYDKSNKRYIGSGSCPSGASCGSNEMLELRDNNQDLYNGKSVFNAVSKLSEINNRLILNDTTITDLQSLDQQLVQLDTSDNKENIGGNTITATSFCMADTISKMKQVEMYEYFAETYKVDVNQVSLPIPLVNIINGGKHSATGHLKIQEFMIFIDEKYATGKQVEMIYKVYQTLRKQLIETYGDTACAIGDEGGFCPPIYSTLEALETIEKAIKTCGYEIGKDVYMALDCAASEFYNTETRLYNVESDKYLNSDDLIEYYKNMLVQHPGIKSMEDAFHETDYDAWKKFTELFSNDIMIVGDDLFTSNPKIIKQGLVEKWANTLLLKVNQIGTISESIVGAHMMFENNMDVIVSHRSGETNHAYLVDIAVGIGAKYVKIGSPCRGERVSKFNRLLEIDFLLQKKNEQV